MYVYVYPFGVSNYLVWLELSGKSNSFFLLCAVHDHIELSLNSSDGVVSPSKIFDNLSCILYFFFCFVFILSFSC